MPRGQNTYILGDTASIAMNAGGQLTPDQRSRFRAGTLRRTGVSMSALIFLLLLFFFLWAGYTGTSQTPETDVVAQFGAFALTAPAAHVIFGLLSLADVLLLALALGNLLIKARFLLDPRSRRIEQADGILLWEQRYVARIPGQRDLRRVCGGGQIENLPPGYYHFYYLPARHWLLSAYPLNVPAAVNPVLFQTPQPGAAPTGLSLLEALASASGFLLGALEANRAGWLTPEQTEALGKAAQRIRIIAILVGLAFLAAGVLAWVLPLLGMGLFSDQTTRLIWSLAAIGVGLYLLVRAFRPVPLQRDIQAGRVMAITGSGIRYRRVVTRSGESGQSTSITYYYIVAGEQFQVSERAYAALVEGLTYRAYYLPSSKRLVNIEPLAA